MTHKVYCIAFSDGYSYVGKTKQEVEVRLQMHSRKDPHHKNIELQRRLDSDSPRIVEVLWEGDDANECDRMERQAIIAQDKPLNKVMTGGKDARKIKHSSKRWSEYVGRKYPRRDGRDYHCSWCREVLPSARFCSDTRRSSGLASRCKACMTVKRNFIDRARRTDSSRKHVSKAYYLAKRLCRANPTRRDRLLKYFNYTPEVKSMEMRTHEDKETRKVRQALRQAIIQATT